MDNDMGEPEMETINSVGSWKINTIWLWTVGVVSEDKNISCPQGTG